MAPPKPKDTSRWRAATRLVHGGTRRTDFQETSEAVFLTSGFVYDSAEEAAARFATESDGFTYSRYDNPTVTMFEERLAALEGAEAALATASGMAAVTAALMCQLRAGDHVVAARALFGSNRVIIEDFLARYGISATFVDGRDPDAWRRALTRETKVFFLETPSNPTLEIIDIAAISRIAHEAGARVIVDNVFATPILQNCFARRADIVVYSATKHIDGQGRCLGGIVLGSRQFIRDELRPFLRNTGPSLSPFNAWVLLKGLETLELRVNAQSAAAASLADFLAEQSGVARVLYPTREDHPDYRLAKRQMSAGGTLIAFEIDGGTADVFRVLNGLRLISISNNLGDTKSLITHPATTTHYRLGPAKRAEIGIRDGLVRLSVGLEDAEDLKADLAAALGAG
ncbi:MAG: O-succinylhomoserine sulfhydrylase [Alphaproteobacteria bacterium]